MNLFWTFGRNTWPGDQPGARFLPTQDNTTQKNVDTHIHASSEIPTHDPSVRAVEDSARSWDRHVSDVMQQFSLKKEENL
jgi:hypothetical protein